MRCALALLAVAAALAGCGSSDTPSGSSGASASAKLADLVVTVDNDGARGAGTPRRLELTCDDPRDSIACGAAAGVSEADLAPAPKNVACTQIFGGPETATITGTLRGNAVDASFSRTNGCEVSRWQHVQPLLDEVR
jgi:hypothetical protein